MNLGEYVFDGQVRLCDRMLDRAVAISTASTECSQIDLVVGGVRVCALETNHGHVPVQN